MNKKFKFDRLYYNVGLSSSSFLHHGCRYHEAGGRNEINDAITFLSNCTPCKFPPKKNGARFTFRVWIEHNWRGKFQDWRQWGDWVLSLHCPERYNPENGWFWNIASGLKLWVLHLLRFSWLKNSSATSCVMHKRKHVGRYCGWPEGALQWQDK